MREIIFRGQTRRKGEKVRLDGTPVDSIWVYGSVLQSKGYFSIIYQTEPEIEKFPVYTNTICQYTGLTDKNGKKIFEGDIVQYSKANQKRKQSGIILYTDDRFLIDWITNFLFANDILKYWHDDIEVIGNIFDNPELLESGD